MIPVIPIIQLIPSQSSTTDADNLKVGDNLFAYIGRDILLGSTSAKAINAGHHTSIAVYGELAGKFGISLQADSDLSIGATGSIWGSLLGIGEDTATNGRIFNDGSVFGGVEGVEFLNATNAELHNSGSIVAGHVPGVSNGGVVLFTENSETALIDNSGFIGAQLAGSFAIRSFGNGVETILNSGTLQGNISLDDGNDIVDTSRGTVNGRIDMGGGNDTVLGSASADILAGGDGNDSLSGNAGNDFIAGGSGADRVFGNAGADGLEGGADGDVFVFLSKTDSGAAKSAQDHVLDFTHTQGDRIDLKAIDAIAGTGANNAFHFIGKQAFHHTKGELHYAVSHGNALVSGDIDGNGAADFTIRLDHVSSLVAGDFIL